MVDRYLFPKLSVNSFTGIRENDGYGRRTDGRQTDDDGCPCDDSSSGVQQHKADLINKFTEDATVE